MRLVTMSLDMKTIRLRLVEENDAEFILSLRLDEKYNKFLSSVSSEIEDQKKWIQQYKNEEKARKQFYFIIERIDNNNPCGTVRIYDLSQDSFSWGSWILNENKTKYAALESAFLVYKFGFDELGYKKSHFDVRKENIKVIGFHEKMGAKKTYEDQENFYFEIQEADVTICKNRLISKLS